MTAKRIVKTIYFLGFVLALAEAFPAYIKSSFIEQFVTVARVGLFFIGSSLISLLAINFFPFFIKKFTNYRLALLILGINIASYLTLIVTNSPLLAFIAFALGEMTIILLWINMDVFLERLTPNVTTGRMRTVYFTFINFGWLGAPLAVGYILSVNNYRFIYLVAIFLVLLVLGTLMYKRKELEEHVQYKHQPTLKTLKNIWQRFELRNIFIIAFLLSLFYAIAVIYLPIYLHEYIGFSWQNIGVIFTLMLIPFVILEIPAGIFADKFNGEKKIFTIGFLILALACISFFFIRSPSILIWGLILFLSRCGAALIEAMRESYFFKVVNVEDIDYINLFRNLFPLSFLVGSILGVLVIKFFPFQYLFLLLAIILLFGFFSIARLKRV